MEGGAGDDFLFGDGGDDQLDGGAGDDMVHGNNGNETLSAGRVQISSLARLAGMQFMVANILISFLAEIRQVCWTAMIFFWISC